jgi:hypothetical protein
MTFFAIIGIACCVVTLGVACLAGYAVWRDVRRGAESLDQDR